jgi:hypothetical protein
MAGRPLRHRMVQQIMGCYEGFRLLVGINPAGVITGFGFSPASTKDQPLAETFFALRAQPSERLPSTGSAALGVRT